MFGFGPFLISRLWRGIEWEYFWLLLFVVICLSAWHFNRVLTYEPVNVLPEAAARAPTGAIDEFVRRYEEQGYLVYHTRDLDPDARERNRVIIEYVVMTQDRQQAWNFKWAWEVPWQLTVNWARIGGAEDPERFDELVEQCRLVPLSQWAREVHEELESYIASGRS